MARITLSLLLSLLGSLSLVAQGSSDPVAQALSQGDLYQSLITTINPCACHTSEKFAHNSFACHGSKFVQL